MGLSVVLELRHRLQLILGGVEDRVILRSWEKEETGMNTEITVFEKPIKRIRDLMGSRMAASLRRGGFEVTSERVESAADAVRHSGRWLALLMRLN